MMENLQTSIRNTVRAVIIRNGHILLQKKQDELNNIRFALPGGKQEVGETLEQALKRECKEELDSDITVGDILHVADFFKEKLIPEPLIKHQLEILFSCQIAEDYLPKNGPKPDKHQIGVNWIALTDLSGIDMSPQFLYDILANLTPSETIYLGKIN